MGFSPREVDSLSLWQLAAAFDGYLAAQGVDPGLSADERARAAALLDRIEGR